MSNFQKALNLWLIAGHSQKEFVAITGLGQSVCSRLFTGMRSPTPEQRAQIFHGFEPVDPHQGRLFLKADLEDQLPAEARKDLEIVITSRSKAKPMDKANRLEASKNALIEELQSNDPHALELALALYDWKQRGSRLYTSSL